MQQNKTLSNLLKTQSTNRKGIKMKVELDISQIEFLVKERINQFAKDKMIANLFWQMYENYLNDDINIFEDTELNDIVDNDYINYCRVIYKDGEEEEYNDLLKLFEEGNRDISCEENNHRFSFIEAIDEYNGLILVRW